MPQGPERVYQDWCLLTADDEILVPIAGRSFDEGYDPVEV